MPRAFTKAEPTNPSPHVSFFASVSAYSRAQLKDAGMMAGSGSGVSARQLAAEGYTIKDLKDAGFKPFTIRKELNCPLTDLKEAGFTAAQFKAEGFGPAELQKAGFELKAIKAAGFQAKQLGVKAGFTLQQLRAAGFQAVEVKSIGGVTPEMMLNAGYSQQAINSAFTKAELSGEKPLQPAPPSMMELLEKAKAEKEAAANQFSLPEKNRPGIEALTQTHRRLWSGEGVDASITALAFCA